MYSRLLEDDTADIGPAGGRGLGLAIGRRRRWFSPGVGADRDRKRVTVKPRLGYFTRRAPENSPQFIGPLLSGSDGHNMAGLQSGAPTPQSITVHSASKVLEVDFSDGAAFRIPFELMRIYSPSAEVQGHGPGQEVLQTGKREVALTGLEPVGNYAVQPAFSDGHDTGIFSWDYLYFLGSQQERLWADYTTRLAAAGVERDSPMPEKAGHGCASH